MKIQDRIDFRVKVLIALYEIYFETGGENLSDEYVDFDNNENAKEYHLAFDYLYKKGFLEYTKLGNTFKVRINIQGIDFVENDLIDRVV